VDKKTDKRKSGGTTEAPGTSFCIEPSVPGRLLADTIATGAALVAVILTFRPFPRAHFNPAVTLAEASQQGIAWNEVPGYPIVQILGVLLWSRLRALDAPSSRDRATRAVACRKSPANSSQPSD
jgi:Major intrinsic protein